MSEVHILVGRAQVFTHSAQTNSWVPSSPSPATLLLYHHQGNNTYRVIARGFEDPNQILINFAITKDVSYKYASANFHTMSDQRTHYGINFATKDEADQWGSGIENVINQLKNSGGSSPFYPPPAQPSQPQYQPQQQPQYQPQAQAQQSPLSSSQPMTKPQMQLPPQIAKPGAPQPLQQPPQMQIPARSPSVSLGKSAPVPPSGPLAPPPAPKPPAPPAPPPPSSNQARGAFLSSIESFSKAGLKKTVTVDKSGPLIGGSHSAASTPSSGSSLNVGGGGAGAASKAAPMGGGGGGNMMAEMMAKRNAMKKTPGVSVPRDESTPVPSQPAPASTPTPAPITKAAVPTPAPATSKPKPPPAASRPNLSPSNTAPAPSALTDPDMIALKEEILSEFKKELAKFKEEIMVAIRSSR